MKEELMYHIPTAVIRVLGAKSYKEAWDAADEVIFHYSDGSGCIFGKSQKTQGITRKIEAYKFLSFYLRETITEEEAESWLKNHKLKDMVKDIYDDFEDLDFYYYKDRWYRDNFGYPVDGISDILDIQVIEGNPIFFEIKFSFTLPVLWGFGQTIDIKKTNEYRNSDLTIIKCKKTCKLTEKDLSFKYWWILYIDLNEPRDEYGRYRIKHILKKDWRQYDDYIKDVDMFSLGESFYQLPVQDNEYIIYAIII